MYIIGVVFFLVALASAFFLADKLSTTQMFFIYGYFPIAMGLLKKFFLERKGYLKNPNLIAIYNWIFLGMVTALLCVVFFYTGQNGGFRS